MRLENNMLETIVLWAFIALTVNGPIVTASPTREVCEQVRAVYVAKNWPGTDKPCRPVRLVVDSNT